MLMFGQLEPGLRIKLTRNASVCLGPVGCALLAKQVCFGGLYADGDPQ